MQFLDDLVKNKDLLDHFTKFIDFSTLMELFKIKEYEILVEESVKRNGEYDRLVKEYKMFLAVLRNITRLFSNGMPMPKYS